MPSRVIELLQCWNGGFVKGDPGVIWGAFPLCLMWTIWREHISKLSNI